MSRDPIGFADGLSLYRGYFVGKATDPSGHKVSAGLEIVGYLGWGGGLGASFSAESSECCRDGVIIPDGRKSISIGIHAEGGIGIGAKWNATLGRFGLGFDLTLGKIAASVDVKQTITNKTCGEYDFDTVCGTVSEEIEWSSNFSGNAGVPGLFGSADITLSASVSAKLTLEYCIGPNGASYKSTICGGARMTAILNYDIDLGIKKFNGTLNANNHTKYGCYVLGEGSMGTI
jgi:hypothetical protein